MTDKTDASFIRSILNYDPETGQLTWAVTRKATHPAGSIAGTTHSRGYRVVGISGKFFKSHRLAWLIFYGKWPAGELDHINGDKTDNRIANLRVVTRSQNMINIDRARSDNRLGVRGVTKVGSRYMARFQDKYLGSFKSTEDAKAAYLMAKQQGEQA